MGKRRLLFDALRLVLPAVWLGLIIGISMIEAPLKFQAPGITIPLGLGIGRLVFAAMNAVEAVIAAGLLVAVLGSKTAGLERALTLIAVSLLALKALVIRPIMQATTDLVISGASSGGSATHYLYIAADGLLIVLLISILVSAARSLLRAKPVLPENTATGRDAAVG